MSISESEIDRKIEALRGKGRIGARWVSTGISELWIGEVHDLVTSVGEAGDVFYEVGNFRTSNLQEAIQGWLRREVRVLISLEGALEDQEQVLEKLRGGGLDALDPDEGNWLSWAYWPRNQDEAEEGLARDIAKNRAEIARYYA